jgi:opacity protein-like surface antigen
MKPALVRRSALVFAALLPLTVAGAQQLPPAASSSANRAVGAWAFGLGVNSQELNLGTNRPGTRVELFSSLARYWSLSPDVSLRIQAIGGAQAPRALTLNAANGCADCEVWSSRQFAGINGALVYEMRQGKAFRPYVLGGAGLTYVHTRQRFEGSCTGTNSCTFVDPWLTTHVGSSTAFGFVAGAGATMRVGKADLFAEYTRYPVSPFRTGLLPLSIGLRF